MCSVLDGVVNEIEPAPDIVSVIASTKPSYLLGIDVGTSGVRAALFDERGNQTFGTQKRRRVRGDFAELDADALVDEVIKTIDELLNYNFHATGQIDLIAISTFWHSLIGVDREGNATTPLLTWADTSAAKIVNDLRSQFNELEIHARTGCRFHSSYWPAKLYLLKLKHPEKFGNTRCWLGFAEYLCLRLFGEAATTISMASATGLFDQRQCDWDWSFVSALGISPDTLPEIKTRLSLQLSESFAFRWPALAEARLITIVGDG